MVREIRSNGKDMSIECGEHVRMNSFFLSLFSASSNANLFLPGETVKTVLTKIVVRSQLIKKKEKRKRKFSYDQFLSSLDWIAILRDTHGVHDGERRLTESSRRIIYRRLQKVTPSPIDRPVRAIYSDVWTSASRLMCDPLCGYFRSPQMWASLSPL